MAKPRAKTLQERMGFMEDDLTTPGHDAIMLWLDANMDACLQDWLGIDAWTPTERALMNELAAHWSGYIRWTRSAVEQAQQTLLELGPSQASDEPEDRIQAAIRYMNGGDIRARLEAQEAAERRLQAEDIIRQTTDILADETFRLTIPPFPGLKVTKKTWEEPLTTTREYTIGFIDLVVSWKRPSLSYAKSSVMIQQYFEKSPWIWNQYSHWEAWNPTWEIHFETQQVAFEVKTTIPSLGELLRQLKLYEQHFIGKIFVVAPDARFAEKIREQGFGFIQSPTNL